MAKTKKAAASDDWQRYTEENLGVSLGQLAARLRELAKLLDGGPLDATSAAIANDCIGPGGVSKLLMIYLCKWRPGERAPVQVTLRVSELSEAEKYLKKHLTNAGIVLDRIVCKSIDPSEAASKLRLAADGIDARPTVIDKSKLHHTVIDIGDFIAKNDRATASEIAKALGITAATVHRHMSETLNPLGFTNVGGYVAPDNW